MEKDASSIQEIRVSLPCLDGASQLKQCISKFKPEVMLCIAFLYVCTSLEETSIEKMHFKKLKRECNLVGEASLQSCEIIVGGIVWHRSRSSESRQSIDQFKFCSLAGHQISKWNLANNFSRLLNFCRWIIHLSVLHIKKTEE